MTTTAKSKAKKTTAAKPNGQIQAATIDELRQKKQPLTRKVPIYFDDETPELLAEAQDKFDRAKMLLDVDAEKYGDQFAKAKAALEEAEKNAAENCRYMIFKAIGRKRYDALLTEHKASEEPTQEEKDELKALGLEKAPFDGRTFPVALVSASLAEPKMTEEEVQEIFDEWNGAEVGQLFQAALEVNTLRRQAEMGK